MIAHSKEVQKARLECRTLSPKGACPPATATPRAGVSEKGPEGSVGPGSTWPHYLVGLGAVHREGRGAGMKGTASVKERAEG